ncbi:transcription termination/antitermination protein NusG [Azospirillum argentinense]|uniref:transcription termination/antitermination protein NusG n=1 Tax=Azospirillum argentinense TaxID=2970906 RepID=UPI0032DF5DCE
MTAMLTSPLIDLPILDGKVWHVAVVKPQVQCRKIATDALRRRGYAVLMPMCREQMTRSGRTETVERSMFGRYFFVGVGPWQDAWELRWCPGIQHLTLDARRRPITVHVDVLRAIVDRMEADGGAVDLRPRQPVQAFRPGQAVEVLEGPFAGFQGLFEADEGKRVRVLVSLFGGQSVVKVPAHGIAAGN